MINAWHRSSEISKRLDAIPGVGPALATALVASVADPRAFRSGRAAPRRLDLGDVDLPHVHHGLKRALCFLAAGR